MAERSYAGETHRHRDDRLCRSGGGDDLRVRQDAGRVRAVRGRGLLLRQRPAAQRRFARQDRGSDGSGLRATPETSRCPERDHHRWLLAARFGPGSQLRCCDRLVGALG